jgi:hypothetical protein
MLKWLRHTPEPDPDNTGVGNGKLVGLIKYKPSAFYVGWLFL